jgi:hypothetical protein
MTRFESVDHCLAEVAGSARLRREAFFAHNEQIASRLDRPLAVTATPLDPTYASDRAVLGPGAILTVGAGLESAFRHDWFPYEAWGAWSAAERAVLHFTLRGDVGLPAKLRFEFCALIAGGQVRHARLSSPVRELAVTEFARSGVFVTVDVRITPADLGPGRELDLAVEIDGLVSPAAATGAGDDRMLGPGLMRVSVVLPAPLRLRSRIGFQRRRLANLVRRARTRLEQQGLMRGGAHLVRAVLRRLS